MSYRIIICKSFGPFEFDAPTYEDAIAVLRRKWFSSGVWDVKLFKDGEEIDISDLVRSWGDRPMYC